MTTTSGDQLAALLGEFLRRHRDEILQEWAGSPFFLGVGQEPDQVTRDCAEVLIGLQRAVEAGTEDDPAAEGFTSIRALLRGIVAQNVDGEDLVGGTALYLSGLKEPLLRRWYEEDNSVRIASLGAVSLSTAVNTLRLVVVDAALSAGLETIASQRDQLTELSTPVIKLWDRVLAIPLIGTLDSMRSQIATENLLQGIVDQQAKVAILDITGVPTVDTMVAQHLLKTVMAARLMGAECVICGIRPQIAHTMVQLGIDLDEVTTRAGLSDALTYALGRLGLSVVPAEASAGRR
jgi:rsbT co-antagonist protein RsbR